MDGIGLRMFRFTLGGIRLSEGQLRLNYLETKLIFDTHSFTAEIKMFTAYHKSYFHCAQSNPSVTSVMGFCKKTKKKQLLCLNCYKGMKGLKVPWLCFFLILCVI